MSREPLGIIAAVLVLGGVYGTAGAAPLGNDFTYQGQLKQAGAPAEGHHDFIFRLFDAPNGGSQVAGDVAINAVSVSKGLFTVQLDFGAGVFTNQARWLEVAVRESDIGGAHTVLSPRQPLTAAPVAQYALNAPGGGSGHWSLNGNSIYNNNDGGVGIGTTSPEFNLHVRGGDGVGGLWPPTKFGIHWRQLVLPAPENDWFTTEVGGSGLVGAPWGPGARLVRKSGTPIHFQTEDTMNSATRVTQMTLDAGGKLGIGTREPISMLEVVSTSGVHGIRSTTSAIPVAAYRDSSTGTWPAIHAESGSGANAAKGIRSYMTSESPGTGASAVYGQISGTTLNGYGVHGYHAGYGTGVFGESANGIGVQASAPNNIAVYGASTSNTGVYGTSVNGTGVYGYSTHGYAGEFNGTVSVKVLEITGADLAEKFPVSEAIKPGMVVAIDPDHAGELCLARGAYNRRVAGVVSGAGDIPTGTIMGNLPGREDATAVALSGRVWAYADAKSQAIQVGDLLTTSDKPGHAMAVADHARAQGAIVGKAMTPLAKGESGLVLVLVSLQ